MVGFSCIGWYNVKNTKSEEYVVRGTWERDIANYLTQNNIYWIKNKQIVYYKPDGSKHRYNPDFYIPDKNLYLEVKGYYSPVDKEKMKLVMEQNKINVVIINKELKNNLLNGLSKLF